MKAYQVELESGERMTIVTSEEDVESLIFGVFLVKAKTIKPL